MTSAARRGHNVFKLPSPHRRQAPRQTPGSAVHPTSEIGNSIPSVDVCLRRHNADRIQERLKGMTPTGYRSHALQPGEPSLLNLRTG
ncbi:IS3 family transposase [Streptomyces sp. AA4]|uniref:IS3 family transposase n=1 Tax=Actinomycetes TaxID=1760 RepID=UPI00336A0B35